MTALDQEPRSHSPVEAQLRAVLDAVPTALLLVDPEGSIRYANDRAAAIFGYAPGDMDNRAVLELLPGGVDIARPPGGALGARVARLRAVQDPLACRRTGEVFPAEVLVNTLELAGRMHRIVTVSDLTDKRRAEQEVAVERESMAHMSRVTLVGEISGSLAHELNQPLSAILSNAQAALRILRRDPGDIADIREILEDIVENDRRAGEVISRLRGLLRRECRSFGVLTANDLVHDAIHIMRNDLINRGVEYRLDMAVNTCRVQGDPVQLQQVLLNLIINGCDAMQDHSPRVLTLRTVAGAGGVVRIEVCDSGTGIELDRLDTIFEPFQSSKPHGMGMGLAICRTLLRAHGGRIWAHNQAGGGACLSIELPLVE